MPRISAAFLSFCFAAGACGAAPAHAVVQGTASANPYVVRLLGAHYCTGVAIARRLVATAAHCAHLRVQAGGRSIATAARLRRAQLDDGRFVTVSGDAVILQLVAPLPAAAGIAPVGEGDGDHFTVAGYGTTDERWRARFGTLHEARLVAAERFALVDPHRSGAISASACFGDSGGPVLRGGTLVGIVTRAAHPSPRIACGHLTRWAPVMVSGAAAEIAVVETTPQSPLKRKLRTARTKSGVAVSQSVFDLFGFNRASGEPAILRRTARNKSAAR